MKKRIFSSICAVALASLVLFCACMVALVYQKSARDGYAAMQADATYIAAGLGAGGMEYLSSIRGYPGRITLIAADGAVLFDDRENPAQMNNHANRPEVAAAREKGSGQAQRQSDTLDERTLYYALRLEDGSVLRLSLQTASLWGQVAQFVPWLLAATLLLVAAAALTARWQVRRILQPVNSLDLDKPLDAEAYEELAPLLRKIASQKQQIEKALQELERRQREFAAITQSMDEGLLVLSHDGRVLTINESARHILGLQERPREPVALLALSRNLALEQAVKKATGGKRAEETLALNGRQYRLVASPSGPENKRGAVLLLMDDTEKLEAEQTRREFSANVSHELKTPLTSISGYAEIIKDGLVKPADLAGFAGKIHDEAARLIALVNDIIRLSSLDERQAPAPKETVDLYALAAQTAEALRDRAGEKGVGLAVEGQVTETAGVPAVLLEILFNLMDNGIRYTNAGGGVTAAVGKRGNEAFIRVEDSGIGIPPEHQDRIFERFYRVEKSHSRENGGTGLGLSIVKRGALFHGGRVELISEAGKGSVFTVWLPCK